MQYDFLKHFPKRMKNVGLYALLFQNSSQKTTWNKYGFQEMHEQMNVIFTLLLYVMEQSLKEETCTRDDIAMYLDTINTQYFQKSITYEECRDLVEFIINMILGNGGLPMYFYGYEFEESAYQEIHIQYIANRIIYEDTGIRRTSYYLTDDGYNMLLSTMEMENNMKITIHEMIFKMHLEKQNYDQAVDEIKNIFSRMRIQLQKIQEAMQKIRRNALSYSVEDYRQILEENLATIDETKKKFQGYREQVKKRANELEEQGINIQKLNQKERESLNDLHVIEDYLNRTIDEHQKILGSHFDMKTLYADELEKLSQMSLIRRFSLRNELYEPLLKNVSLLKNLDYFLHPLFHQRLEQIYNLNKSLELQRPVRKRAEEEDEVIDFDEEEFLEEKQRRQQEKLLKYEQSLGFLLEQAALSKSITLQNLWEQCEKSGIDKEKLIPTVEIFKEIMVELIKSREMDIVSLQNERKELLKEQVLEFQLKDMVLDLIDNNRNLHDIRRIEVARTEERQIIEFAQVRTEQGALRCIRCSNVCIRITREQEELQGE
ncbi:MAG: hypothetical protein HFI75_00825 [Lachnospiraceae bacterium]|nr:hypothetical protein [Lachnospiraceae bacterium]